MLGPSLVGQQLFAAGDLIEQRAPWAEESTVTSVTNVCISDTIDGAIPTELTFRARVAAGDDAPLWENDAAAGAMLGSAPPGGTSSPIFLATLPFSDVSFTAWMKVFEVAVAVAGTVLWARRVGLSGAAGALGGLIFATSSFMVMWTNWPQTRTAAFIPMLFWSLERIVQDRTLRSALPLPVVVACLVLGGFPAIAVHTVYFAVLYAVVRLVLLNREAAAGAQISSIDGRWLWRHWLKPPLLAAAGGAAALLLVGFQLAPWVEQLRGTDLGYRQNIWAQTLGWRDLLTAAFPQAGGTCASDATMWGTVVPVEAVSFVGAGTLVLGVAALVLPLAGERMRGIRPLLVVGVALVVAVSFMGGPVNYLLHYLPFLDNSPMHRSRALGTALTAMLAAVGFDAVRRSAGSSGWLRWVPVVLAPAALVAAAFAARRVAPTAEAWAQVKDSVLLGVVVGLGVALAWAWSMTGWRGSRGVAVTVIPLLVLVDALAFTQAFWPRTEPDRLYRDTSTDAFLSEHLGHDRLAGIENTYWNGANKVNGLASITGHHFVPPEWRDLMTAADPDIFLSPTNSTLSGIDALSSPVLDRFAVRYGVADTGTMPPGDVLGTDERDPFETVVLGEDDGGRLLPAGTGLRAVLIELAEPVGNLDEAGDPVHVTATVADPDGEVLASGERRLRDGSAGIFVVPVAGEETAAADVALEVQVNVSGRDGATAPAGGLSVVGATETATAQTGPAWVGLVTSQPDGLELVETAEAQVYERTTALSRFRWASDAEACDDLATCARLMGEVGDTTVLLEARDAASVGLDDAPADVEVEVDQGDYARVHVDADGQGMLVVADSFHPDWHAYVDGEEADVIRADYAMRGVVVPPGRHTVEWSYEPTGWDILTWVAAGAAGLLVVTWSVVAVRDRRRVS